MSAKNHKKLRKLINTKYAADIDEFVEAFDKVLNNAPLKQRLHYAWKVLRGRIGKRKETK